MQKSLLNKYINKIKSNFFSLYNLPNDMEFVKATCEENNIKEVNDEIVRLFEKCRNKVIKDKISDVKVYEMIIDGIHKISENDELNRLIQGVINKVEEKAKEYNVPYHSALNYHIALGIIATYFYTAITEARYISVKTNI